MNQEKCQVNAWLDPWNVHVIARNFCESLAQSNLVIQFILQGIYVVIWSVFTDNVDPEPFWLLILLLW